MKLENKSVVITGASRGIGEALSVAFAKQGCSMHLIHTPESKEDMQRVLKKCEESGAKAKCYECDLTAADECNKLCKELQGNVDVLINNAGEFTGAKAEEEIFKGDPDAWEHMFKVNAIAPMRLTHALAPTMADKGDAAIVNIGDVEAIHTGPSHPAYSASKAALRSYSFACYEALRNKGIRVVHLAPGNVEGARMTDVKEEGQGMIPADDVAMAAVQALAFTSAVPEEICLKALKSS